MRSTPLHAKTSLPSLVAVMLRTTPPPEGIVQISNFCLCGSKRASVFGLHAGFAVPDDVTEAGDPVRDRSPDHSVNGQSRQCPFRIKSAEKAAGIIRIPDRAVTRDGDAPRPACRVRQWIFVNLHRLWVNARKFVGAELCEKWDSVRVHGDPIGQSVFGRHMDELYVARFRYQPADHVCALTP